MIIFLNFKTCTCSASELKWSSPEKSQEKAKSFSAVSGAFRSPEKKDGAEGLLLLLHLHDAQLHTALRLLGVAGFCAISPLAFPSNTFGSSRAGAIPVTQIRSRPECCQDRPDAVLRVLGWSAEIQVIPSKGAVPKGCSAGIFNGEGEAPLVAERARGLKSRNAAVRTSG